MEIKQFRHRKIKRWYAAVVQTSDGRHFVITADDHLCWNDNPVMLDGIVYYDFPNRIPKYAQELTVKAFKWLKEMQDASKG